MTSRADLLRDRIIAHFLPKPPETLGVAVSGGSDSLALLVLLNDWRREGGPKLVAVTVDHRLRDEARDEAEQVARICEGLDIPHETLAWTDWNGQGNLPDQARRARYGLMVDWASARGIDAIALGHTADDQAETFLMRLAREAGVDGLSAMAATRRQGKVIFCRPALHISREELRDVLRDRGMAWVDDPSNADLAYERVRARQVLAALAPLGITAQNLSNVAHHMSDVRDTLYWYAFLAARKSVGFQQGDLLIDRKGFRALRGEIARRLLQDALKWVSGAEYGPRGRAMDLLLDAIRSGNSMTLQGCQITVGTEQLRVSREYNAVAGLRCGTDEIWDGRWKITGPVTVGAEIAALGHEGLSECPEWRESGLPLASVIASPAVWQGRELLAAPVARSENGWSAEMIRDGEHYFAALLSH